MNKTILESSGIDYPAGIRRFMGDGELYEELLRAFLSDETFSKACAAFDGGDYNELFEQAHALKGASGNLDMPMLYRASGELTEALRNNGATEAEQVSKLFDELRTAYMRVINGIRAACAQ